MLAGVTLTPVNRTRAAAAEDRPPGVSSAPAAAVTVPASIPHDLSADATAALNAFFVKLPHGTTVRFPDKARYLIEGTVLLAGKNGITIEGNGVLFRSMTPGAQHAKKENYGGWRATRTRAHLRIKDCSNIVIHDVHVHGAHPNAGRKGVYDYNREAQHGFDIVGVRGCTLQRVNVHDVYGDCVYIAKSRGVIVRDSTLKRCGRQGIAVATGEDVLIENNTIADSRRGIIDIEPYGKDWSTGNIRIIGNRLGGSRLLLLPMGGSGVIGAVFIADNVNTEPNGTPAILNKGKPGQHRGPFMLINNRFTIGGSPTQGLRIQHNDGVCIAGNVFQFPAKRAMTALSLDGSKGVVAGNRFVDAAALLNVPTKQAGAGRDAKAAEPDHAGIQFVSNATDAAPPTDDGPAASKRLPRTQWKRIHGGFASRTVTTDGEVIALMRGGPSNVRQPRPALLEGYGQSTEAGFAWFHVRGGKVIAKGARK